MSDLDVSRRKLTLPGFERTNVTMGYRQPLVVLLVGALLALAPLAQSSPPDPTWIGGLYDNADYDDIVLTVTSGVAAVEWLSPSAGDPLVVSVAPRAPGDDSLVSLLRASSYHTRAPPVA